MIEALVNTGSGYIISLALLHLLHRFYGVSLGVDSELVIVTIFTVASVIRGYIIRRVFNNFYKDRKK